MTGTHLSGDQAADIDVATIRHNGLIPAETKPVSIGDGHGDGIADLMVKFSRAEVEAWLAGRPCDVEMTVSGKAGTRNFEGTTVIRVLR